MLPATRLKASGDSDPIFDAAVSNGTESGATITVAAGATVFAACSTSGGAGGQNPSGMTLAGVAGTLLGTYVPSQRITVYRWTNVSAGSKAIAIQGLSGSDAALCAVSYLGVTTTGTWTTQSGTTGPTITGTGTVLTFFNKNNESPAVAVTAGTSRASATEGGGWSSALAIAETNAGTAAVTSNADGGAAVLLS